MIPVTVDKDDGVVGCPVRLCVKHFLRGCFLRGGEDKDTFLSFVFFVIDLRLLCFETSPRRPRCSEGGGTNPMF